jgi:hypothetical protein
MSTVDTIYSNTAAFGHFYSYIQAGFATIMMVIFVAVGIYILWNNAHLVTTQGKVTKATYNCQTKNQGNNQITTCQVDVSYEIDGKTINNTFNTAIQYTVGQSVTVFYTPGDTSDASISHTPNWMAWLAIGGGIVIALGSYLWVWLTGKYQVVGAFAGAQDIFGFIRR